MNEFGALVEREGNRPAEVLGNNTFRNATFFHHKSHRDGRGIESGGKEVGKRQ
jgi:hypothetical protein